MDPVQAVAAASQTSFVVVAYAAGLVYDSGASVRSEEGKEETDPA